MCLVKDYVYCCGGFDEFLNLDQCERFSLKDSKWVDDVPDMVQPKFS